MIELIIIELTNNFDKFVDILFLITTGFTMRIVLEIFGQTWIRTKAHTSTVLILPIITYVITNLISGNIALSLGMVGALSIVRFRNPVRSPLELSVYFASITLGIAASVSLQWLLFLASALIIAVFSLIAANFISGSILRRPFFTASFSEGNSLSSLTISSNKEIDILGSHRLLQSKTFSKESEITIYHLVSNNFELLKKIEEDGIVRSSSISIELKR